MKWGTMLSTGQSIAEYVWSISVSFTTSLMEKFNIAAVANEFEVKWTTGGKYARLDVLKYKVVPVVQRVKNPTHEFE